MAVAIHVAKNDAIEDTTYALLNSSLSEPWGGDWKTLATRGRISAGIFAATVTVKASVIAVLIAMLAAEKPYIRTRLFLFDLNH
ncbi:MAG: hypothetical protein ACJ70X_05975, partial [Nitrososphaera sp.]